MGASKYKKAPIAVKQFGMLAIYVYDIFRDDGQDYCIAGYSDEPARKYKLHYGVQMGSSYFTLKGLRHYLCDFVKV